MVNHYETVFILTPVLSDVQMKETVKKFDNLIKSNNGEIINREEWGLKKLAYPIDGKSVGFYVLIQFNAETSFINVLETEFRRDERVIRFLTTRLDKYALQYAERRAANRMAKLNEMRENKRRHRFDNDRPVSHENDIILQPSQREITDNKEMDVEEMTTDTQNQIKSDVVDSTPNPTENE